ncbi:MAG: YaaL family protein [Firmicutes bacterium]|nr:YaaL family protein [Bacillota bacterium]
MKPPFRQWLKALADSVLISQDEGNQTGVATNLQLEMLEQAKQEWLAAREYFEHTADPDLIDHAIYQLWAAEKKYQYLLKKAREENLNNEVLENPWSCLR